MQRWHISLLSMRICQIFDFPPPPPPGGAASASADSSSSQTDPGRNLAESVLPGQQKSYEHVAWNFFNKVLFSEIGFFPEISSRWSPWKRSAALAACSTRLTGDPNRNRHLLPMKYNFSDETMIEIVIKDNFQQSSFLKIWKLMQFEIDAAMENELGGGACVRVAPPTIQVQIGIRFDFFCFIFIIWHRDKLWFQTVTWCHSQQSSFFRFSFNWARAW